jgi:2-keto-4-pentenoate hydratase/2-oxohepta-3-ene-1,7-dioic acid hydratase in catechol pathway
MRAAIEAAALAALAQAAGPKLSIGQVTLTIPVANPEKIICVGVNYPDRNAEYKDGQEAPPNMSLFIRFPRSFTGHDQPLIRPPESEQLDYEGEVVIVIGKGGRRISQAAAYDHIAGITLANEGTLRDWVRHAKFNVTQGKNFDASGSIGPWLVPFTDAAQLDDIALETRVNGAVRQQDRTGRMLFPFRRIVEYISTFTTLVPGDTILCGTPTGAGARFDPPIWLKSGDVVEVTATGIGTLRNTVADEVLP